MGKGRKNRKLRSSETAGTSQTQQQINNEFGKIITVNKTTQNVVNVLGASVSIPGDIDDLDCTKLKRYFKNTLCQVSPLPWYPEHTWNILEVNTELALEGLENKFGVEELFKQCPERFPEGDSYRILIEGDAGYGKSTLMLKIASDWSNRDSNDKTNYTSRFSLLLLVKLGGVGEDGNLFSYMESTYNEKIDKPLEDVLKSKGTEKVLILLDGYDEANANTKKDVDKIMKKENWIDCHVVLTSRIGHVPKDVKNNALCVTVECFVQKQVMVAVGTFFIKAGLLTKADVEQWCKDELLKHKKTQRGKSQVLPSIDDFKNVTEPTEILPKGKRLGMNQFKQFMIKVRYRSPYKYLAQCPLLCVRLCYLVSECPTRKLPSTCSGLYFAMINRNLYRAIIKKDKDAEKVLKWNWKVLDRRIHKDHESYLQEFGRLCVDGLKTRSMSFTLFELTGNGDDAETSDVRVTRLIEAGVLVQDVTKLNDNEDICYQVPHRTMAEFLAAYYLSGETDQNLLQQNLLDLFRLEASFKKVWVSLIEMGKPRCLADAFHVIKFPSDCLKFIPFMERYFAQHGATGTWSEFKDALPNKLQTRSVDHDIIVSSSVPCLTLLELIEEFGKMNTGNTNALRSLPKECLVSVQVERARNLPILLQTLQSGVVLNSLEINFIESSISDQMQHEVARRLQELLKAGSCPVQLSFTEASSVITKAVTEAMQEVPAGCRLRRFEFFPKRRGGNSDILQVLKLLEVLAEKWLSHLHHLAIPSKLEDNRTVESSNASPCELPGNSQSGGRVNPILKGLGEPGCRLTSLHLFGYTDFHNRGMLLEDLMMLMTKLKTLRLEKMKLCFDVTKISQYAVNEKCYLKSLHLVRVTLRLDGELPSADENKEFLLGWRNVALQLEELTIDDFGFPVELFSWLNLSVSNLRTLSIGRVVKRMPNGDRDSNEYEDELEALRYSCANQLLEALTRSSGKSIEELSLSKGFWRTYKGLTVEQIQEALQSCQRIKKVKLELADSLTKSIGPGPSTPSSSDVKALKSDNMYMPLLRIVLSVPKLQNLNLTLKNKGLFDYYKDIGTFHAIADKAEKWPGKSSDNEYNTLTLHGLSNRQACDAMYVFRERGLKHCLRYVSDKVYKLWFPV